MFLSTYRSAARRPERAARGQTLRLAALSAAIRARSGSASPAATGSASRIPLAFAARAREPRNDRRQPALVPRRCGTCLSGELETQAGTFSRQRPPDAPQPAGEGDPQLPPGFDLQKVGRETLPVELEDSNRPCRPGRLALDAELAAHQRGVTVRADDQGDLALERPAHHAAGMCHPVAGRVAVDAVDGAGDAFRTGVETAQTVAPAHFDALGRERREQELLELALRNHQHERMRPVERPQLELGPADRAVVERHPVDPVAAGDQSRGDPEPIEPVERRRVKGQRVAQPRPPLRLVDDLDLTISIAHQGESRGQTGRAGSHHQNIDRPLQRHGQPAFPALREDPDSRATCEYELRRSASHHPATRGNLRRRACLFG